MPARLTFRQYVNLPLHHQGNFDHGDIYRSNGYIFLANTAANAIEVIDGEHLVYLVTLPGCLEASGVLCVQEEGLVFAAARGAGKILVIDAIFTTILREITVGNRPHGLAWDQRRKHLLVADVADNKARYVDTMTNQVIVTLDLPGKPDWAVYYQSRDAFLVTLREPASVAVLCAETGLLFERFPVKAIGPHGIALDFIDSRMFVTCDDGNVVVLNVVTGQEIARVILPGLPDDIWHDQKHERLYVTMKAGMIAVIDTRTMVVDTWIPTEVGTHTIVYDTQRERLYAFLPNCRIAVYAEGAD